MLCFLIIIFFSILSFQVGGVGKGRRFFEGGGVRGGGEDISVMIEPVLRSEGKGSKAKGSKGTYYIMGLIWTQ